MLLATGASFDLVQFIRILCWILLPLFAIASLVTIFFHYRNKKRDRSALAQVDEAFLQASPELLGYTKGDGEYVFFDNSATISEYKKRLALNHAKYTALQHDYEKLATKFATIAAYTTSLSSANAGNENAVAGLPDELVNEIDKLAAAHTTERTELVSRFEYLSKNFLSLEQEHLLTLDRLSQSEAAINDHQAIQKRLDNELQSSLAENKHLRSLLQEREIQLSEISNTSITRQQEISILKNELAASVLATASLNASLVEHQSRILSLEEQLAKPEVPVPVPELAALINPDTEVSPVIDINEYIKRESEEVLAQ